MTPFHPMFRRLLHRNIPQLDNQDIDRYDSLIALRHNLVQEKHVVSTTTVVVDPETKVPIPPPNFNIDIAETTRQMQEILAPHAKVYDASLRLWVARRQLLLHQGNFLQIPFTRKSLKILVAAIWNYRKVQLQTFSTLAGNRIRYYFENLSVGRVLIIAISIILFIICLYSLTPKERPNPQPNPPGVQQQLR